MSEMLIFHGYNGFLSFAVAYKQATYVNQNYELTSTVIFNSYLFYNKVLHLLKENYI